MDGYLLDTNHLVPLLRDSHPHRKPILNGLTNAAKDAPVFVATATLAELEVGCCIGPQDRSDAQTEIREIIRENRLNVIDFTKHTAAEYGTLKAGLMHKYNRQGVKNAAKRPEIWTSPDKGATLGVDEFDLLIISHAIERKLVLVTIDQMRRIFEGVVWPGDCPEPVNWTSEADE